ncbi:uncharacterized protein LOC131654042 isoform X2 [Vicia villosa]|uniref:uncharacterized protein LOC131654042 isoform X2 n=2 Tax=Vicia villosa TaxID=3911 RepID=UPI00273BDF94|nr:uncharacterized protein LOC131654042 isoform X2 [Vicia villosa]
MIFFIVFHSVIGFHRRDRNCISLMDTDNGIPNQGDWRSQLHPGSRQRIVNKIMEGLKKHVPVSGQEGLLELQNIAQMFEDKNFTVATSQSDYLKKIATRMLEFEIKSRGTVVTNISSSLDMLTLETESQDTMANNITSSLETESQDTMANNLTPSLDMETESQGTMANNLAPSLDMETESQGTMANNLTPSLDTETESQGTMANNMTSNQVGPINEPLDPANGKPDQGDWRGKLQPGTRERTVNKLLNTLIRCLPFPGLEGLPQLQKLAQKYEERVFTAATSKSDYAMKIFLRSLKIETKHQGAFLANGVTWNQIDPDQGDWRSTLKPEAREKVINRIRYTLKKQLPIVSGHEGSDEFGKIAQSLEEGIFTCATSKADYARKICLKHHALKTKYEGPENIIPMKLVQLRK